MDNNAYTVEEEQRGAASYDTFPSPRDTDSENENSGKAEAESYRVYTSRWFILALFVLYSSSNAYHWNQFAIITITTKNFFNVSPSMVNWTSILYEITYIPLIFPASWFLEKHGLRKSVLIGSCGTMIGSWVKVGSVGRDLWWVAFTGQFITACSQIFILGIPARLAAVWFDAKQVSTACAIGVFGNQLGVAMGFLLPPIFVPAFPEGGDAAAVAATSAGFRAMFYSEAGLTTVLFITIIFVFKEKPPTPPSAAAASSEEDTGSYLQGIKRLMSNPGYVLLLLSYGINVGVFYGLSTLLAQVVEVYFPGQEKNAGRIGLLIVVAGMLGSVACGFVLDKTKKFKFVTVVLYVMSTVFCLGYTFIFTAHQLWLVFVMAALMGFFMTGYLPVGFEFAAELTYPEAEGTSSGLLNASAQFFGIFTTLANGHMLEAFGDIPANLCLVATLVVGTVMTACIPEDLRRQKVQTQLL